MCLHLDSRNGRKIIAFLFPKDCAKCCDKAETGPFCGSQARNVVSRCPNSLLSTCLQPLKQHLFAIISVFGVKNPCGKKSANILVLFKDLQYI